MTRILLQVWCFRVIFVWFFFSFLFGPIQFLHQGRKRILGGSLIGLEQRPAAARHTILFMYLCVLLYGHYNIAITCVIYTAGRWVSEYTVYYHKLDHKTNRNTLGCFKRLRFSSIKKKNTLYVYIYMGRCTYNTHGSCEHWTVYIHSYYR